MGVLLVRLKICAGIPDLVNNLFANSGAVEDGDTPSAAGDVETDLFRVAPSPLYLSDRLIQILQDVKQHRGRLIQILQDVKQHRGRQYAFSAVVVVVVVCWWW